MKPAHITRDGVPICVCEQHHAGLLGPASPVDFKIASCSFRSISDAQRALWAMSKHRDGLAVVRGHCPAYEKERDPREPYVEALRAVIQSEHKVILSKGEEKYRAQAQKTKALARATDLVRGYKEETANEDRPG